MVKCCECIYLGELITNRHYTQIVLRPVSMWKREVMKEKYNQFLGYLHMCKLPGDHKFVLVSEGCDRGIKKPSRKEKFLIQRNELMDREFTCPGPDVGRLDKRYKYVYHTGELVNYALCMRSPACGCKAFDKIAEQVNEVQDEIDAADEDFAV